MVAVLITMLTVFRHRKPPQASWTYCAPGTAHAQVSAAYDPKNLPLTDARGSEPNPKIDFHRSVEIRANPSRGLHWVQYCNDPRNPVRRAASVQLLSHRR